MTPPRLTPPKEYELTGRLAWLVKYCEKSCVAGCCGISAFDFSPLHVASCLSGTSGCISKEDIDVWHKELEKVERDLESYQPTPEGLLCSIKGMNQGFTQRDIKALLEELRYSISISPEVLAFSNQKRSPTSVHKVCSESEDAFRALLYPDSNRGNEKKSPSQS